MGIFSRKSAKAKPEAVEAGSKDAATAVASQAGSSPKVTGPYDVTEAPEAARFDLGALKIPELEGAQVALEVDKASGIATGATVAVGESAVQLNVFAAPKSEQLWQSVRSALRESISEQGGTTETREGSFGTELYARIPVQSSKGARSYRPLRFVGVDGPRWLLRAVISGAAMQHGEEREKVEELLRGLVVDRGRSPMAPREVVTLTVPSALTSAEGSGARSLDDLDPGPTVAEIR